MLYIARIGSKCLPPTVIADIGAFRSGSEAAFPTVRSSNSRDPAIRMKTHKFSLPLAFALSASFSALAAPPSGSSRLDAACGQLKKVIAAHDGLVETGPAGVGWFCDFAQTGSELDDEWYVIALRSNRTCEGICSNLMGWYAVHRESGEVHEFDISEFAVGARLLVPVGAVR